MGGRIFNFELQCQWSQQVVSYSQLNSQFWSSGEGSGLRDHFWNYLLVDERAQCLNLKSQEEFINQERTGTAISLEAERKGKVGGRSIARDGEGKPGVMWRKQMKKLFQPKGYSQHILRG